MNLVAAFFESHPEVGISLSIGILVFALLFFYKRIDLSASAMRSSNWLSRNYIWIIIGFGCILIVTAIVLYVHQLPGLIRKTVTALEAAYVESPEDDEKLRNLAYTFAALAGALTVMATIPFQLIRVWLNERSASTEEQGHITDQITKAIEGLGAEKIVKDNTDERTVPNVEVRVGAVYALERIAQDSGRDHIQIMEILTAYIRENSPASSAESRSDDPTEHEVALRNARASARYAQLDPVFYQNLAWIWGRNLTINTDVQAAIRVIGRRDIKLHSVQRIDRRYGEMGYLLDLQKTNLQGADLSYLNFEGSLLPEIYLDGANLQFTDLSNTDLRWSQLRGTTLVSAVMNGADLSEADIIGADLSYAALTGATLHHTNIIDSDLSYANFKSTDLSQATLQGVDLSDSVFDENTNFNVSSNTGSALKNCDLSCNPDGLLEFIQNSFGDSSVKLPETLKAGEGPLSHWEASELEPSEFYRCWRSWQRCTGYFNGSISFTHTDKKK